MKNEAANALTRFEEFLMAMINLKTVAAHPATQKLRRNGCNTRERFFANFLVEATTCKEDCMVF